MRWATGWRSATRGPGKVRSLGRARGASVTHAQVCGVTPQVYYPRVSLGEPVGSDVANPCRLPVNCRGAVSCTARWATSPVDARAAAACRRPTVLSVRNRESGSPERKGGAKLGAEAGKVSNSHKGRRDGVLFHSPAGGVQLRAGLRRLPGVGVEVLSDHGLARGFPHLIPSASWAWDVLFEVDPRLDFVGRVHLTHLGRFRY